MKRKIIIITGSMMVLLGTCWILLWLVMPIGINDAEVGNIKRAGQPSNPEKMIWGEWMTGGDEEIVPFNTNIDLRSSDPIAVRYGVGKTWACSFKIYQIKFHFPDGTITDVYGYGPNWGTSMNMTLPWATLIVGVMITMFGGFGLIKHTTIRPTEP